jgi:L-malate glycosyltransferase
VLCSESEGLSNSVIEYMQAGRPVVCTNVGGNPELVVEGVSGYLVEVGDHAALADRMMVLLSDETVARAMGEKGRKSIMNICATSRMLEAQMACYDEVLSP